MRLPVLLSLLLLRDCLASPTAHPGMPTGLITQKLQIYTVPMRSSFTGFSSAPVMYQKGDRDTLRRLRNILMSLLEGLPESKKSFPEPVVHPLMLNIHPALVTVPRKVSDWALSREIDEDVSELMSIQEDTEAQTKGGRNEMAMMQNLEEISNEVASTASSSNSTGSQSFPNSTVAIAEKYINSTRDAEKALEKSIQMEEKVERKLDKEIGTMKKTQRSLKGKEAQNENILKNLERISKEVENVPGIGLSRPSPYRSAVEEAEGYLDKSIQMEEKAEQMMDKEIASMKSAHKHVGPPEDMQQFGQLMRYLDKYIPDLNSYLKMDSELGATERAFALLAILKNFLCVGREMPTQNSQKYFKSLLEDEMHILRALLDNND